MGNLLAARLRAIAGAQRFALALSLIVSLCALFAAFVAPGPIIVRVIRASVVCIGLFAVAGALLYSDLVPRRSWRGWLGALFVIAFTLFGITIIVASPALSPWTRTYRACLGALFILAAGFGWLPLSALGRFKAAAIVLATVELAAGVYVMLAVDVPAVFVAIDKPMHATVTMLTSRGIPVSPQFGGAVASVVPAFVYVHGRLRTSVYTADSLHAFHGASPRVLYDAFSRTYARPGFWQMPSCMIMHQTGVPFDGYKNPNFRDGFFTSNVLPCFRSIDPPAANALLARLVAAPDPISALPALSGTTPMCRRLRAQEHALDLSSIIRDDPIDFALLRGIVAGGPLRNPSEGAMMKAVIHYCKVRRALPGRHRPHVGIGAT